ncbi:acetylxylan esterase [Microbacterium oryzae]|uniref:acetylxylan esterase n=1 Tax=Microbacterium oryzae TaxID=743009 RepID=UPI0025AF991D|nr:acetylxylan esterase [Microbacterium oryzae]MDN3311163.1 acetylxylan esterase [Microbacterium oryzae]
MAHPYTQWFPDAVRDGTYGYDLDALRAVEPVAPPPGFEDFWRCRYVDAGGAPADAVLTPLGQRAGREVFEVEYTAAGGLRLRGWLARPVDGRPPRVGVVFGHGYGGRDALDFDRVPDDAAVLFPVARGLGALNARVGAPLPEEGHVLFGIESVDDYVLGWCAADLWHAANALRELVGEVPLYYVGESFGGGIGALAVPWDDRFVGATLIVPSFGQYDLRLQLPCEGSGELVREHVAQHPEAREVLRFFDASTAALFARIPVRAECALWDGVVPPPGQFAVADAVQDLDLEVLPAGHAEYPGLQETLARCHAATRRHIEASLTSQS